MAMIPHEDRSRQLEPWRYWPTHQFQDFEREVERIRKEMAERDREFWEKNRFPEKSGRPGWQVSPFVGMQGPKDGVSTRDVVGRDGRNSLQMNFDVRDYRPEEIQVTADGNSIRVHAKHEQSTGAGQTYREFTRQFTLPNNVDLNGISSHLTYDGVLAVEAPYIANQLQAGPTVIPIKYK